MTGLGYVGLPVAAAFAAAGFEVVAFDIDARRVGELREGRDRTGEVDPARLAAPGLRLTTDPADLAAADFHIVTVPTPITEERRPDLRPLVSASRTVGRALKRGDVVVYESTVYPGATEEDCVPVLEAESGLVFGRDFAVGYSPERINPGDPVHRFETITKVVSGSDPETLAVVAETYGAVVTAGIHRASSIKVAEAAKVIENTQRDLNIALMNELAQIFDRLDIRTADVLAAAGTKWNFLRFTPGLVGGHCIGVDPYYLTAKAEALGYRPEIILAGRRTNDGMGAFVAQKLVKTLAKSGRIRGARVGVLGLTFKEDVPDLRNSRVPDVVRELAEFGIEALVHDPFADPEEAKGEYGLVLSPLESFFDLDALVLAVPHGSYLALGPESLASRLVPDGILVDLKSRLSPASIPGGVTVWSL
ncbi:nucleotide sugar dehydrogenase [Salinarimonas sp.]|uniref:nucleotide sugar dehydrogenase n=1 Tax=Salinarimonas sp. TaxID=2766526 RepID=UPI0032D8FB29